MTTTDLRSLVGDVEMFRTAVWKRRAACHHAEPPELITEAGMLEMLESGPLLWPYFEVCRDGVPLPVEEVTTERRILNRTVPGYPRRRTVLDAYRAGATLMFRRPEHWHAAVRSLLAGLELAFDGELCSYAVLTPAGGNGRCPDTAELDTLVVQLAGRATWTVAAPDALPCHWAVTPGDVLYIPHDAPRDAVADDAGASLHLAITVEEPTVRDLVDLLAADFLRRLQQEETARRHHALPAEQKAAWLLACLTRYQQDISAQGLARAATARRRAGAAA